MSSPQEFQTLLENSFKKRMNLEGQVVKGVVVSIDKDMALIDVNLKSEGRVPLKEFLPAKLDVGDEVEVYIDRYEGPQGDVQLSHERARQEASWQQVSESFTGKKPIEGMIINQVKGGLTVDIQGTIAFLPGSQVDIRPVKDLSHFIGTTQQFIVIKVDGSRSNVVVSRRAVLEESRASGRQHLLETLEQGQHLDGVVKNLTDYGAFVDLGGIDGLLHITDIAWKRIQHPSEVLSVGQAIKVMVTRFNKETQRISLGMKQLEKDPWVNITERYKSSDHVHGVVTNVTDYGAFVEMDEGLEGLVYVGDMVWGKKNVDPRQVVSSGQEIEAMILEIDTTKRRISLGLKQCTENPLERFAAKNPIGSEVEGEIKDITEFGLLVHLPEGVDGAIHTSDLVWDSSEDVLSRYSVGSPIKMKVLNINVAKEIIGLGVKQLTKDPWAIHFSQLKKGSSVKATVCRILDQGIEVDLGNQIKTIITRNELSRNRSDQNPQQFAVGDEVEGKVITVNPDTHHIVLSIKAQEIDDEREVLAEYSSAEKGSSLGSLLEAVLESKNKK
jgi:small subunit ribosomal protein S1